jgi:uncharacterized protein YdaU (DUF1376 family)
VTEKSPAFQFYPKEFLADANVAAMSLEERGAYITLLCFCWNEQAIPSSPDKIARILGVKPSRMAKLWPALSHCFVASYGDRLVHPRLQKEREKQEKFREKMRVAGARSGVSRRGKKAEPTPNLPSTKVEPTPNSPISYQEIGDNKPTSGGRVFGLAATPEPRSARLTGTQFEQRRRDAIRDLRGSA